MKQKEWNNIYFHDKIAPSDISSYLQSADIGLVPTWNKKDLSYWYALDNKLFEYINAGIPILATQQPEYKNIIDGYECGVCVNPDVENSYLNGFNTILSDYERFFNNVKKANKELNWENERNKLIDFYSTIL